MAVDIHKRSDLHNVLWIAWPQALGTLVMAFQSMVDMFWIGKLGTAEVAAVALCGNAFNVVFGLMGFLNIGVIALVSRAIGAGEKDKASSTMAHSMVLGALLGVAFLVGGWLGAPSLMSFFGVDDEVTRLGVTYFRIMSVHMMMIAIIIVPMSVYFAAGDTLTPLVVQALALALNIVIDPIFIFAPGEVVNINIFDLIIFDIRPGLLGWGVFGAGFASVLAVLFALIIFLALVSIGRFPLRFPRPSEVSWSLFEFGRIVKIGAPFALAHSSRPLSTVILLRIVAEFGSESVAGFGIAMRWYSINWILIGGLGAAASTLVGQYLGAGEKDSAGRISRRLVMVGFVIQIFVTAGYYYAAPHLIAMMDPNPLTVEPGAWFMRWVVLGFLLSTPGGLAAAAMNGAGATTPGMVAGVISNWLVKLPLAWVLAGYEFLGVDGVWLGMFVSLLVEGAICLVWYWLGGWKDKSLSRGGGAGI